MDDQDDDKADRTFARRKKILDKVGAEVRNAMTKADLSAKKNESLQERREERYEASERFKKRTDWNTAYSNSLSKKGQTVDRHQKKLLNEKFPAADSKMTPAELAEYAAFKETLPDEEKVSLEQTDTLVTQICALQYIPRNPKTSFRYPHGMVAYMNAKKMVKGPGAHGKPTTRVVNPPLTMEWVRFCFKPAYIRLVMKYPREWHRVEIGNAGAHSEDPPEKYLTPIRVAYPQGENHRCLFLCLASALHYINLTDEAAGIAEASTSAEHTSGSKGVAALRLSMELLAPIVGRPTLFNTGHKKKQRVLSVPDVFEYTPFPTVLIPIGADGSVNHAVCLVDDLIFDSTLTYALKCTPESMDWICTGQCGGFVGVQQAIRFSASINCPPLRRIMDDNWEK